MGKGKEQVKKNDTESNKEERKHDPGLDVPPANVNAYEAKQAMKETFQKGMETIKETIKGSDTKEKSPKDDLTKQLQQVGKELKEKEESK